MSYQILIVGPAWVGDMVMAQGLFRLLKEQQPDTQIDVLAPAWTFALLNRMPEVRHAIEMPIKHGELKLGLRYQLAKKLAKMGYDQAILLPNTIKSALIPWLAGIPKRTGWLGEHRYVLLNDARKLDEKKYPRMIDRFVALGLSKDAEPLASPPFPLFKVSDQAKAAALAKYQLHADKPVIALAPGAAFGPSKRWPVAYFAEVANHELAKGRQVWLFGSKDEAGIGDEMMAATNNACKNLIGLAPLDDTIDLFASVSAFVTNDSGQMHIAAAFEKPLIAIYGSTSPIFTPPLAKSAAILQLSLECQPCFARVCPLGHHKCMIDLTPAQVIAVLDSFGSF